MNLMLVALNAKYIHSNLALRYLGKTVDKLVDKLSIVEYTINHSSDYILSEIYKQQPDVIAFSCYIWNMEEIHYLCKTLKKVLPEITIVLGGPEVSYETKALMEENDSIDIVVIGEGELTFPLLVRYLALNEDYSTMEGIAYRCRGSVYLNPPTSSLIDMNLLPFPYDDDSMADLEKIIYYESSRGCPFNCQYCLSSAEQGVRFLPVERVKKELQYFIDKNVRQVKFVDRTFNANKKVAMDIMNYLIIHNKGKTNFHFEVTADLLDKDMLEFLEKAPVGLFQFEIGVQSTNQETLKAIDRKMDFSKLQQAVKTISSYRNIHQHLDLIVGLPYEDYFSFRRSFNDVFSLRPEKLQVGFLKLLKGSGLRAMSEKYGYVYSDYPPYDILENDYLSYGELLRLKGIEEMVEIYWNSRVFNTSIEVLLASFYSNSFGFFEELWRYWEKKGYHHVSHGKNKIYEILFEFFIDKGFASSDVFRELLKFDYLKNTKTSTLPSLFTRVEEEDFKNKCHEFLQKPENVANLLPKYIEQPAKQIIKKVNFQQFLYDVTFLEKHPAELCNVQLNRTTLLFDYDIDNKASDFSRYYKVDLD